jgi:PKD repeat protein
VGSTITLDGSASNDSDGSIVRYRWDLDNDGHYGDATGVTVNFVAATAGTYTVGLRVTDDDGARDTDTAVLDIVDVEEPNQAPYLAHPIQNQTAPANRSFRLQLGPDTFIDPDVKQVLTYTATQADGSRLPRWLRFSSETLTFSGWPLVRDVGQYSIRLTATDSGSPALAASADFTIDVTPHRYPWQNADLPQDVDGNEQVTPLDALILIAQLGVNGASSLPESGPTSAGAPPSFLDVNGDNSASPIDVLMVVNHLNGRGPISVEGESHQQPTSDLAAEPTLPFPTPQVTSEAQTNATVPHLPLLENDQVSADDKPVTPIRTVDRDPIQNTFVSAGNRCAKEDNSDLPSHMDVAFEELDAFLPDIVQDVATAWSHQ